MCRTNKYIRLSAKSFILSIGLTLVACGGGGGSGGTTYPSIQYTGSNTQATVTADNASDFPVAMLEGSTSSSSVNPYASITNSTSTEEVQRASMINMFAEQIKNNILEQKNTGNILSAATVSNPGTCSTNPGTYTESTNVSGNVITASATYSNYCTTSNNVDFTLHGKMNLTVNYNGSTDPNSLVIYNVTISIEYLKMTIKTSTGTHSEEFSGTMTLTFDGTVNNNITNISVSTNFEANGLTYKVQNLVVDTAGSTLNISGQFYHPLHGYVDVTTTEPFDLISTNPDKYCSGSLQVTGAGGVIDFTADASCSSYDLCFTPTGGAQSCTNNIAWP